jgi:hypothetical protein
VQGGGGGSSRPSRAVGNGGAPPCPGSSGVGLLGHRKGEGQSEDVWEVEGGGASLFAGLGAPFKGQR